jgi:hypothetical protein
MSDADLVRSHSVGFAAQFAREGDAFLYRRSQKGPAIAVSVEERNGFVIAFDRWMDIEMLVVLVGGIVAVMLAFVVFPLLAYPMVAITVGVAVILTAVLIGLKLAWDAPAKALAGRPVVAAALSRSEAHRLDIVTSTWSQIGSQAAISSLFLIRYAGHPPMEPWATLWLAPGLFGLGFAALRGYWKLRVGKAPTQVV